MYHLLQDFVVYLVDEELLILDLVVVMQEVELFLYNIDLLVQCFTLLLVLLVLSVLDLFPTALTLQFLHIGYLFLALLADVDLFVLPESGTLTIDDLVVAA